MDNNQPIIQPIIPSQPIPPPPPPRNYLKFIIGGVIILVVFLSGGLFLGKTFYSRKSLTSENITSPTSFPTTIPLVIPSSAPTQAATISINPTSDLYTESSRSATDDWKVYNLNGIGLSFKYPVNWNKGTEAEGCGPIFGPKAKSLPTPMADFTITPGQSGQVPNIPVTVFPYIALCTYNYRLPNPDSLEESVKLYSSFGEVISTSSGRVNGHRYVKVLKNPKTVKDGVIGAILVDHSNQDPKQSFNLTIYISYDPKFYKIYGTQETFSVDQYLKTVDQILSTFKFLD